MSSRKRKPMPKIAPGDPIRAEFRPPGDYAKIAADIFIALAKHNPRPHDWMVLGRTLIHIGVRGVQHNYKMSEMTDRAIATAMEIGDATFRVGNAITSRMKAPAAILPATAFESEVDSIMKGEREGTGSPNNTKIN